MDEFLREIHVAVFKQWILQKNNQLSGIKIVLKDEECIKITTEYSESEINFHEKSIIEMMVKNNTTDDVAFYLHFQMQTLHHAIDLFNEMLACIQKLVERPKIPILLSCSSGLTTGLFAQKLNEAIELLNLNFHVDAFPYHDLFHEGEKYKAIFLAPQISYLQPKIKEVMKDQIVENIPPAIFAKYDAGEMIKFILSVFHKKEKAKAASRSVAPFKTVAKHQDSLLSIVVLRNSHNRVHLMYQVYDKDNHAQPSVEVVKPIIRLRDIYDVIDSHLARYPQIGTIALALPGMIHQGYSSCDFIESLAQHKLKVLFEDKYHKRFVYNNNVTAAAVGYYMSTKEEDDISVIFQPVYYYGEIGTVLHKHPYDGYHGASGEIQYLSLDLSNEYLELVKTPEGSLELLSKIIASISVMIDPATVIVCNQLVTDYKELETEVNKLLPNYCVPEIGMIDMIHIYMHLGQLALCYPETYR